MKVLFDDSVRKRPMVHVLSCQYNDNLELRAIVKRLSEQWILIFRHKILLEAICTDQR